MYKPGFLVLRFSGFCLSVFIVYQYVRTWVFGLRLSGYVPVYLLCTSEYVPGLLVLRFSGFCLCIYYVPVCTYLGPCIFPPIPTSYFERMKTVLFTLFLIFRI